MSINWINWESPDINGNFELGIQHVNGLQDALDNIELTPGPQGEQGVQGETGETGPPGLNGQDGRDGIDGSPGVDGKDGIDGKDGEPGVILYNSGGLVEEHVKMFTGVATTTGTNGTFSLDISAAGFSTVDNVQFTVQAGTFSQADAPLSANYNHETSSSTVINGKAFKATSAGLLAAMQQTPAESGTKINVLVIGR